MSLSSYLWCWESPKVFADSHFLVNVLNFNTEAAIGRCWKWAEEIFFWGDVVIRPDNTLAEACRCRQSCDIKPLFPGRSSIWKRSCCCCCLTHSLPRKAILGKDAGQWENKCPNRELIQSWRAGWGDIDCCCFAGRQPTLGGAAEKDICKDASNNQDFKIQRSSGVKGGGSTDCYCSKPTLWVSPLSWLSFQITLFRNPHSVWSVSTSPVCLAAINSCHINSFHPNLDKEKPGGRFAISIGLHWLFFLPIATAVMYLPSFSSPPPQSQYGQQVVSIAKVSIHRRLRFWAK